MRGICSQRARVVVHAGKLHMCSWPSCCWMRVQTHVYKTVMAKRPVSWRLKTGASGLDTAHLHQRRQQLCCVCVCRAGRGGGGRGARASYCTSVYAALTPMLLQSHHHVLPQNVCGAHRACLPAFHHAVALAPCVTSFPRNGAIEAVGFHMALSACVNTSKISLPGCIAGQPSISHWSYTAAPRLAGSRHPGPYQVGTAGSLTARSWWRRRWCSAHPRARWSCTAGTGTRWREAQNHAPVSTQGPRKLLTT